MNYVYITILSYGEITLLQPINLGDTSHEVVIVMFVVCQEDFAASIFVMTASNPSMRCCDFCSR